MSVVDHDDPRFDQSSREEQFFANAPSPADAPPRQSNYAAERVPLDKPEEVFHRHTETIVEVGAKTPQQEFASDVRFVADQIATLLIEKNRKYGDAALNPLSVFSHSDPIEKINLRMDDKLSRIKNRQNDDDEDPEWDLLGYLIIKQVAMMRKKFEPAQPPTMGEIIRDELNRG